MEGLKTIGVNDHKIKFGKQNSSEIETGIGKIKNDKDKDSLSNKNVILEEDNNELENIISKLQADKDSL